MSTFGNTYPTNPPLDSIAALARELASMRRRIADLERGPARSQPTVYLSQAQPRLGDTAPQAPLHGDMMRFNAVTGLWEPVSFPIVWSAGSTPSAASSGRAIPADDLIFTGFSMNSVGGASTVVLQRNGATIATLGSATGYARVAAQLGTFTATRVIGGTDTYSVQVTATAATSLAGEIEMGSRQSLP